ncbi:uncharacterized protein BDR25DRAFT_344613 [Lindgomyces ingoldianus]|uniref:Uncharacterized protein n=1 Tax=Lindgomyces ingoldianus TaxID=673940 RepID=A0ACB6QLG4_9PLEO|nr:uncharacterized protein BDR25DRAFT_344613 [Lindgomyces ingoldianus]KAF2467849.1 hypothetical protein BDR25DRAFT_344613 [Lindgomyces ingoldianus]
MTWEDLKEARKKHVKKEAKKAAKKAREATTGKKRGRPQKNKMRDTQEPKAKVAWISEIEEGEVGPLDPKVMRRNDAQAKEVELMPKPWRAQWRGCIKLELELSYLLKEVTGSYVRSSGMFISLLPHTKNAIAQPQARHMF